MSQRDSGYERKERDLYETPEWVTEALLPHMGTGNHSAVWEPACGSGKMFRVLNDHYSVAHGTDIMPGHPDFAMCDFLKTDAELLSFDDIISNPPYKLATKFIEQALELTRPHRGRVAMLLRTDFDHAKTRRHLFADHPAFSKKLVLTKRIMWFKPEPGAKGKSPSFNHAWVIWDWKHEGTPTLAYGP